MVFEVIANIYPAKDKVDLVRTELKKLADCVKQNETGTQKYQMYEQMNATDGEPPQFVVVEEYDDQAAFNHHVSTDYFKALGGRIEAEGWFAKPLDIKFVEPLAGFMKR